MKQLTTKEIISLRLIGKYGYVTPSLLSYAGVGTDKLTRAILADLVSKKLLHRLVFSDAAQRPGRNEYFYALNEAGANILVELDHIEKEDINYPSNPRSTFSTDYYHRKTMIKTNIYIDRMCKDKNLDLRFFHTYYTSRKGVKQARGHFQRSTKFSWPDNPKGIWSDGIFCLEKAGNPALWCLEIHNGDDTKRLLEQLAAYCYALSVGQPALTYGLKVPTYILILMELPNYIHYICERMKLYPDIFSAFVDRFYFAPQSALDRDIFSNLTRYDGQIVSFPY
jgi:hypothetical protein